MENGEKLRAMIAAADLSQIKALELFNEEQARLSNSVQYFPDWGSKPNPSDFSKPHDSCYASLCEFNR